MFRSFAVDALKVMLMTSKDETEALDEHVEMISMAMVNTAINTMAFDSIFDHVWLTKTL